MALPVTFSVRTLIAALSLMLGGAVCAAEPDCRPGCNPGIATADAGIASQPTELDSRLRGNDGQSLKQIRIQCHQTGRAGTRLTNQHGGFW